MMDCKNALVETNGNIEESIIGWEKRNLRCRKKIC